MNALESTANVSWTTVLDRGGFVSLFRKRNKESPSPPSFPLSTHTTSEKLVIRRADCINFTADQGEWESTSPTCGSRRTFYALSWL